LKKKARLIAFYLPQFHPIPENDQFWGKGFTEWTNLTKAKPLFRGHEQPKLPADLGFYDLRLPEVRLQQANMAKHYGVEAFCYWHYWFGDGVRVLERVITEVVESKQPDFPFLLGWANESWTGKWHGLDNQYIFKQTYPGFNDFEKHFYEVLPALTDERNFKINDKPVFLVYRPMKIEPSPQHFVDAWQNLAVKNGITNGIYFIGTHNNEDPIQHGFDAVVANAPNFNYPQKTYLKKIFKVISFGKLPNLFSYKKMVDHTVKKSLRKNEFPIITSNWDNTPRSGSKGNILLNDTLKYFEYFLSKTIDKIAGKPEEEKIIFLKSWNEWAEGNFLEPDMKNKDGRLKIIKKLIFENESNSK